jgi:3-oxoadipate enol-lactonase
MPVARVNDIELNYRLEGDGPETVVLVNGLADDLETWVLQMDDLLGAGYRVLRFDNRGVGQSSKPAGPYTTRMFADDTKALVDELGLSDFHMVGISMGGMIAQELTLGHPERVRTLTLGCTYCGGEGSALASEADLGGLVEAMGSGDRERALRAGWEINVSDEMVGDDDAFTTFRAIAMRRAVPVAVIMQQLQACAAHDANARLAQIATPTLVIHGAADRLLPVQNGRLIASLIPGARLEIFDGVGHLFFWERPERSAELVREHAAVAA